MGGALSMSFELYFGVGCGFFKIMSRVRSAIRTGVTPRRINDYPIAIDFF